MKIDYFTGDIFEQLNNVNDNSQKKRIISSIISTVGNCTERFIKYYYDNSNIFNVESIQEDIILNQGDYLFRNRTTINNIVYEQLSIHNIIEIEKFNQIEIKINPTIFYDIILKDILKKNKKDFEKNQDINIIIKNDLQQRYIFLDEILDEKDKIIFKLKSYIIFTKNESDFIIFLKDIGVLSNQKQTIRSDMFITEKHSGKKYIIEVKSRVTHGLTTRDVYSSIYYPIYYNYYNKTNIGLTMIYFGNINDILLSEIKIIKRNYKKFSDGNINIYPFERIIHLLNAKYEHPDLIGIEVVNKSYKDLENSKYSYIELNGIYTFPPKFLLNYTFDLESDITNVKSEDNRIQKEIRRDNNRLLK